MALSRTQKMTMYKEGWLPSEIYAFEHAKGGDVPTNSRVHQNFAFGSITFSATRKSRRNYVKDLHNIGWTYMEIKQKLVDFYRNPTNNPFLFLKLSYTPHKKLSDLQFSYRLSSRAKVSRHFGKAYGRMFRKESRPKYLPKRPLYPNRPRIIRRRYR